MSNTSGNAMDFNNRLETSVEDIKRKALKMMEYYGGKIVVSCFFDSQSECDSKDTTKYYMSQLFDIYDKLARDNFEWEEPFLASKEEGKCQYKLVYASTKYLQESQENLERFAKMSYCQGREVDVLLIS